MLKTEPEAVVGGLKNGTGVGKPTFGAPAMDISSPGQGGDGDFCRGLESLAREPDDSPAQRSKSVSIQLEKTDEEGRYLLTADDSNLRAIL